MDKIKENISTKVEIEKKLKKKLTGNEIILIQHPVTTQLNLVEKQINIMLNSIKNLCSSLQGTHHEDQMFIK